MYALFDRAMSDDEMRDWHDSISSTALSTPATEPQGYVEITEEMIVAGRKAADDQYYKWRGFGPREEGQGLDGMHFIVREALKAALASRPAPQPAADTRVVAAALWREEAVNAGAPNSVAAGRTLASFSEQSPELQARWTKFAACAIRAIIGTAAPAPSDKIAEAAQDKTAAELVIDAYDAANPFRQADMHPALCHCNRCAIDWLRALAGKGE